jgi:dimethylargininase
MPVTATRRLLASALAGLGVGLASFFAASFALFITLQEAPTNIGPITHYFAWPAIVLFVLVTLVGILDGLATTARRVVFSFVAAILAAYIGAVIYFTSAGDPFSQALHDGQTSLVNNNLVFAVFALIAGLTVGAPIYNRVLSVTGKKIEEVHRVALVRPPVANLSEGEVTHVKRTPVNFERAEKQWDAYVGVLEAEGFEIVEIAASEEHPDSAFIEDTVVILGQTAVITSPGAESRRGEQDAVAAAATELGLAVQHIRLPGTLEGGDVLKVGTTVYVGRGGRTNAEGIRQFRAIAGPLGYTVVAVPVTKALHLKSTVTALPDGTIIGHPDLVDHPELFDRYLEVPEPQGIAVVVLSPSAVLLAGSAPKTANLIEDLGYRVITANISEFERLEGCVTCLSVRIR